MDCWHGRTDGERLVMAGVNHCSIQDLNWMWSVCRSLDSSQQCHSVAKSTADRLNSLHQLYHPQHTLHELWARHLSKTHSTVNLHSTKSDVKESQNCARVWNTVAVTWLLVTGQQAEQVNRHGKWRGATGLYEEAHIHMQICKSTTPLDIIVKIV